MILVDRPVWAGREGRHFAHLASDASYDELHAFVAQLDTPRPLRFHRDHYDIPAPWWQTAVDAGAVIVSTKELIARLRAAGLRATSVGSARHRRDV
jgi:hypothetical protein